MWKFVSGQRHRDLMRAALLWAAAIPVAMGAVGRFLKCNAMGGGVRTQKCRRPVDHDTWVAAEAWWPTGSSTKSRAIAGRLMAVGNRSTPGSGFGTLRSNCQLPTGASSCGTNQYVPLLSKQRLHPMARDVQSH
jgi:hypothetical protein